MKHNTSKEKCVIVGDKKNCIVCSHFLPFRDFYPQRGGKYYSKKCRNCTKEYLLNLEGEKLCPECNQIKPYSEFRPNKEWYDRYCKICRNNISAYKYRNDPVWREQHIAHTAKSAKKHRKERTESFRAWKKENPDKVLDCRLKYKDKHQQNNIEYRKRNEDRLRKRSTDQSRSAKEELNDYYVRGILRRQIKDIVIPVALIKLKKLQILGKRIIKQQNGSRRTSQSNV